MVSTLQNEEVQKSLIPGINKLQPKNKKRSQSQIEKQIFRPPIKKEDGLSSEDEQDRHRSKTEDRMNRREIENRRDSEEERYSRMTVLKPGETAISMLHQASTTYSPQHSPNYGANDMYNS